MGRTHKAMISAWVRNTNTGRVGQVKRVAKDPEHKSQSAVLVGIPGKRGLLFWPNEFIRPVKRLPSKLKGRKHGR